MSIRVQFTRFAEEIRQLVTTAFRQATWTWWPRTVGDAPIIRFEDAGELRLRGYPAPVVGNRSGVYGVVQQRRAERTSPVCATGRRRPL